MSESQLTRAAVKLFPLRPYLAISAVLHARRAYVRSRLALGDNWILSTTHSPKGKA